MNPTLLVLAAGMGSRYGGLKQVDPVGPNGETVLDYSVYDAARAGFGKVVFVIRRDFEALFRERVGARHAGAIAIDYAFQELETLPDGVQLDLSGRTKPWGTSHAIWCAREAINTPFAVINADDFYGRSSFETLCGYLAGLSPEDRSPFPTALVGFRLANTLSDHGSVSRGVCSVRENRLASVRECTGVHRNEAGSVVGIDPDGNPIELTGEELVSMNFWGFTPAVFPELEAGIRAFLEKRGGEAKSEYYIPTAVSEWIAAGKTEVDVLSSSATWFGVTYQEDKPLVVAAIRELIDQGVYPENLGVS